MKHLKLMELVDLDNNNKSPKSKSKSNSPKSNSPKSNSPKSNSPKSNSPKQSPKSNSPKSPKQRQQEILSELDKLKSETISHIRNISAPHVDLNIPPYQTIDKQYQHEISELKAENIRLQKIITELRKQLITLLKDKQPSIENKFSLEKSIKSYQERADERDLLHKQVAELTEENKLLKEQITQLKTQANQIIPVHNVEIEKRLRLIQQEEQALKEARQLFLKERDREIDKVNMVLKQEYQKMEETKKQYENIIRDLQLQLQDKKMDLMIQMQKKSDKAAYEHQLMKNRINVNRERPELKYREEYPELFQAKLKEMSQAERHNREIKHVKNSEELKRIKFDERRKTINFMNQDRIRMIKANRNDLYGISKIKHAEHPEAPAILNDPLANKSYYLFDILDDTTDLTPDSYENERFYLKIKQIGSNRYLYLYPKY